MATQKYHQATVKIIPEVPIPDKYRRAFKAALDVLATDANVPVALIMRGWTRTK